MGEATISNTECEGFKRSTINLLDLSHNSLVLANIVAYLPPSGITKLSATNRAIRDTITHTPGVYRHLDLRTIKNVQTDLGAIDHGGEIWRNTQLDENLTEDDFYAGPLRGLFTTLRRRNIFHDVQTLILDGLSVTSDLCHDIINDPQFNVRLLSVRGVRNLNHGKLRGALQYACRPSREGSPCLKGLYLFGPSDGQLSPISGAIRDSPSIVVTQQNQQDNGDAWWEIKGRQLKRPVPAEWANCLMACSGVIAFDALLCQGPRHRNSPVAGSSAVLAEHGPAIATYSLSGCEGCGKAPEGMITPTSHAAAHLPLLAPPPIMSSSLRAATTPNSTGSSFVPRCADCIGERYCHCCNKWWCESCYQLPGQSHQQEPAVIIMDDGEQSNMMVEEMTLEEFTPKIKSRVTKSCWECGNSCEECINRTQRVCKKCCAGYCTVHNEGSSAEFCDWCVSRGRRMAKTKGQEGSPPTPGILRDLRLVHRMRRRAAF